MVWSGVCMMAQVLEENKVDRFADEALLKCPECGSASIITDMSRGELICGNCGVVLDDHLIDSGPEWRSFSFTDDQKRNRTGLPVSVTLHDKGLTTHINNTQQDAFGKPLSVQQKNRMQRLRRWQLRTRLRTSAERNLAYALSDIERISSQLGLPKSVVETAAIIYKQAAAKKLIRGRSISAMVAASIYAAARLRRVPRSLEEISAMTRSSRKEVGRCYRVLVSELKLKVPVADPADYAVRFGSELHLSGQVIRKALDMLHKAKRAGITTGKDPTGLAAACLYLSSILENEKRTQREIAQVASITEVTVRNRYKELQQSLGIEISMFDNIE